MKEYKLKEIKRLVAIGAAVDLTNAPNLEAWRKNTRYEKIGYSCGIYGINGGLLEAEDGQLYAITAPNANLLRIF